MASSITPPNNFSAESTKKNYTPALTVLTTLFFMWGFLTCLNDILIPHLKAVFSLNYTEAMLIQFSFFAAYFIVSLPSGIIVEKIGYKKGIIIGLITAGIGCLTFYPAAGIRSYPLFLLALFILASGITLLQVAANPYVAILGKPQTASSRLNLTQAFNSLGTTIAPYFGSLLILSIAAKNSEEIAKMSSADLTAYQLAEASAVQVPYLGLAAALFIIAGLIAVFKLPKIEAGSVASSDGDGKSYDELHQSAWKYKHLLMGAVAIFVYVGAEVSIGSFLVNYFGDSEIMGLSEVEAGKFVSFYWGGAMVGRFIGSAVQRKIKPGYVLSFNAVIASLLVVVSMLSYGYVAMWSILLVGLFNSIMFPTIFTLAINGLGKHTGQGSGILCMAIVGGAIIPVIQGFIADNIGIHHAFILPVICYFFIAYYGVRGSIPSFKKVQLVPET
ncbi:MAG: L-fucose:H+ symporter permease [Ignavibacteriales bacterium]|nr:MAG: L-fucose:H+ symporter permease [Ignavibacteriales bacterium]